MYVATAAVVAALQLLSSWAGAGLMMSDPRAFVESMVENDLLWADQLDVNVKVDTALVTPAAMAVLRKLNVVDGAGRPLQPAAGKKAPPTVATVNALTVVVEVACVRAHQGDAVEFALAVAASAFKCRTLPLVLAQTLAIDATVQYRVAANFQRPRAVWDTLGRYLDKLSGYRESLRTVAEMHRLWATVVKQTLPPLPGNEHGTMGDAARFRGLVEDALRVTCDPSAAAAVYERLDVGGPETWDTADATKAAYEGAQHELDDTMDRLPVSTMDRKLWKEYLHT